jgi:hypothetical protein
MYPGAPVEGCFCQVKFDSSLENLQDHVEKRKSQNQGACNVMFLMIKMI